MEKKKMKLAEIVNGRAAMFGCVFLFIAAITTNTNLPSTLQSLNLQSIWLALGVYAG